MIGDTPKRGTGDPAAVIRAIWNSNRDEVMGRVAVLEDAVAAMIEGRLSVLDRSAAERGAHKLAGAAGTFGFDRASEAARTLEEILAGTDPISPDWTLLAADEVVALRGDLSRNPVLGGEPAVDRFGTPAQAPAAGGTRPADETSPKDPPPGAHLAIAVTSRRRRKQLAAAAADRGFQAVTAGAHGGFPQEGGPPVAALIELRSGDSCLELIRHSAALDPPVPVLALTPVNGSCDRIAAARAGAHGFVRAEASSAEILDAVQGLLAPPGVDESTVLILDHAPASLSSMAAVLRKAGLRVVALGDLAQFWKVLDEVQPDLVILGSEIPGVGGAELCRIVRSDAGWAGLPLVLVVAADHAGDVAELFEAGADDVVARPVAGADLVGRVRNRLERVRVLRAGARCDSADNALSVAEDAPPAAGPISALYDVDVAVIEDDPLLAELLGHALSTRGYRFRSLTDGLAAAVELAGSPPALRSRVVLLDVDLPGLNGFGVLRRMAVTGSLAATRVIMLTARSSEREIVDALELGAFDYVAKPFSVPVLMQRVRRALGD